MRARAGGARAGRGAADLDKRVDREDREVGLRLRVVDQVEVDELLELDVDRLDAVDDVSEEHRDVLADGHRGDHLLHRILLLLHLRVAQLLAQLMDLACARAQPQ